MNWNAFDHHRSYTGSNYGNAFIGFLFLIAAAILASPVAVFGRVVSRLLNTMDGRMGDVRAAIGVDPDRSLPGGFLGRWKGEIAYLAVTAIVVAVGWGPTHKPLVLGAFVQHVHAGRYDDHFHLNVHEDLDGAECHPVVVVEAMGHRGEVHCRMEGQIDVPASEIPAGATQLTVTGETGGFPLTRRGTVAVNLGP